MGKRKVRVYAKGGPVNYFQGGGQQQPQETDQIMMLVQAYAQITGQDPQQIMQQLMSLPEDQLQQAVQQMADAVQQAQSQEAQMPAEGMEPPAEQAMAPQEMAPPVNGQVPQEAAPMMMFGGDPSKYMKKTKRLMKKKVGGMAETNQTFDTVQAKVANDIKSSIGKNFVNNMIDKSAERFMENQVNPQNYFNVGGYYGSYSPMGNRYTDTFNANLSAATGMLQQTGLSFMDALGDYGSSFEKGIMAKGKFRDPETGKTVKTKNWMPGVGFDDFRPEAKCGGRMMKCGGMKKYQDGGQNTLISDKAGNQRYVTEEEATMWYDALKGTDTMEGNPDLSFSDLSFASDSPNREAVATYTDQEQPTTPSWAEGLNVNRVDIDYRKPMFRPGKQGAMKEATIYFDTPGFAPSTPAQSAKPSFAERRAERREERQMAKEGPREVGGFESWFGRKIVNPIRDMRSGMGTMRRNPMMPWNRGSMEMGGQLPSYQMEGEVMLDSPYESPMTSFMNQGVPEMPYDQPVLYETNEYMGGEGTPLEMPEMTSNPAGELNLKEKIKANMGAAARAGMRGAQWLTSAKNFGDLQDRASSVYMLNQNAVTLPGDVPGSMGTSFTVGQTAGQAVPAQGLLDGRWAGPTAGAIPGGGMIANPYVKSGGRIELGEQYLTDEEIQMILMNGGTVEYY